MKLIGLVGGMSWQSTLLYYRLLNEEVEKRLGGVHSARILMHSVDFERLARVSSKEEQQKALKHLQEVCVGLEKGGADFLLLCSNTIHFFADGIQEVIGIPLLHIAEATGECIQEAGLDCVGLLGTRHTMKQPFYRQRLEKRGLRVVTPEHDDTLAVHSIIFDELIRGEILETSLANIKQVVQRLEEKGAQGMILGCTELPLLMKQTDFDLPLFDTTTIHAMAASRMAFSSSIGA